MARSSYDPQGEQDSTYGEIVVPGCSSLRVFDLRKRVGLRRRYPMYRTGRILVSPFRNDFISKFGKEYHKLHLDAGIRR